MSVFTGPVQMDGVFYLDKDCYFDKNEVIVRFRNAKHKQYAPLCLFNYYGTEKDVRHSAICLCGFAEAEGDDPLIIGFFLR